MPHPIKLYHCATSYMPPGVGSLWLEGASLAISQFDRRSAEDIPVVYCVESPTSVLWVIGYPALSELLQLVGVPSTARPPDLQQNAGVHAALARTGAHWLLFEEDYPPGSGNGSRSWIRISPLPIPLSIR